MRRTTPPSQQALIEHVHTAKCAEHGCPTLWPSPSARESGPGRRLTRRLVVAAASGLVIAMSWGATAAASSTYTSMHC